MCVSHFIGGPSRRRVNGKAAYSINSALFFLGIMLVGLISPAWADGELPPLPRGLELGSPKAAPGPVDLAPYLNMTPGITLAYQALEDTGLGFQPAGIEVQAFRSLPGGYLGVVDAMSPNFTPDWVDLWKQEADGFYYHGGLSLLMPEWERFSPAAGPVGTMNVGETQTFDVNVTTETGVYPVHIELTLLQAGISFTTPTATYYDCVLVRIVGPDSTEYTVYANGVGMVFQYDFGVGDPPWIEYLIAVL